ncbi:DUF7332 family protein [Halobellus rubicundus]|uniref:Uncharacterized protein n=1 Tax=Halobellus rubicundus TaxID=2996466 RepID=A0ABD5MBK3_9EURY
MPTPRTPDTLRRAVAVFAALAVCASLALAGLPAVAAQSGGDGGAAAADSDRCFPPGGHDLAVGSGDPHINVTVHTSLFTSAPPNALGLSARGVALDADIVRLRTGVLFEANQENVSVGQIWDSFVVVFDYRLSLPMFSDAFDDSTYEPSEGPVSGVETRGC